MMGQPAETGAIERLSPVASANETGLDPCSQHGTAACRRRHLNDDTTRISCRTQCANHASTTPPNRVTSSTTHPCALHTCNQRDSATRINGRHATKRRSSSHTITDSVFSLKSDLARHTTTSSSLWFPFSGRMYMGNIKPWTLSLAVYLLVIILSNGVAATHSLPTQLSAASRRVVEQRMRRVSTLEEYMNAFRTNETRSVHSRYRNPNPTVNKRSYRRWGRAGNDVSISSGEPGQAIMDKIRAEEMKAMCQPRDQVVDSYEEFGIPRGYGQFIFPPCIVVKRCKNGGCCGDAQECVAAVKVNKTMNFLVDLQAVTREIEHDARCECQPKPSFCPPPGVDCSENKVWSYSECACKCRNRCPKPFMQDENTCGCDCLSQDRSCKNIYRGRRNQKLSREECDCVKKGLCGKPPCLNGRFSMSDCRCLNTNS